jgi:hypothetical protein
MSMSTDSQRGEEGRDRPKGVDWSDPDVPAGDSPPLPPWPLHVSATLWGGWIIFLAVVVLSS